MTSFRQIAANRRNASKSTGPTTKEGKQRSRCNAVRHGLTAETVLEASEDYKTFEARHRSFPPRRCQYGSPISSRRWFRGSKLEPIFSNAMARSEMTLVETPSPIRTFGDPSRHDWTREELRAPFDLPLSELIFRAQSIHRAHFDPSEVQLSTLLSIKTGGWPGGLRLLSAERPIRHRRARREAEAARQSAGGSARGAGRRRQPLLHGRGVALTQTSAR
jgi:hypothetical protein